MNFLYPFLGWGRVAWLPLDTCYLWPYLYVSFIKKIAPSIIKPHQMFLIVAECFGFEEIAFSLAITLTTFPSTTGTAWISKSGNYWMAKDASYITRTEICRIFLPPWMQSKQLHQLYSFLFLAPPEEQRWF